MKNFVIRNSAHETAEIDIFGDIGEGWFNDGHTVESVRNQLSEINTKDLIVNISSLGGDVNHALAIHDMLKMHKAKVTTKVTGFTASSGTIIAMAGDVVEMSDNALFLVHNAWSGVVGNQHDLREFADELAKVDDRIINIYAKKTGKRRDTIHNLMKEEKWIDANEARDFGFIDKVFEPVAIAASIEKINESDLPKLPERIITKINDMNLKEEFDAFKNSITETIEGIKNSIVEKHTETEVTLLDNEEVTAKITEIENKVEEAVDSLHEANEEISAKVAEIEMLNAKIAELESEVAKNNALPTTVESVDADPTGTPKAKSAWEELADQLRNKL